MSHIYPDFSRVADAVLHATDPIITVIAESGAGKTTLLHHIASRCRSATVYMPARSRITTSHVCDALIADLTGRHHYGSLERRARILRDGLIRAGRIHLLIDDAQEIDTRTLRDLTGIVEMCLPARPLHVTLFGTPSLDYRISHESALTAIHESRLRLDLPPPPIQEYLRHIDMYDTMMPCAIAAIERAEIPIRALPTVCAGARVLADKIGEKVSAEEIGRTLHPHPAPAAEHQHRRIA